VDCISLLIAGHADLLLEGSSVMEDADPVLFISCRVLVFYLILVVHSRSSYSGNSWPVLPGYLEHLWSLT
jgi:hypothetical protein